MVSIASFKSSSKLLDVHFVNLCPIQSEIDNDITVTMSTSQVKPFRLLNAHFFLKLSTSSIQNVLINFFTIYYMSVIKPHTHFYDAFLLLGFKVKASLFSRFVLNDT